MQRSKPSERVVVTGDGKGVAGHSGALLLVEVADRLGLTAVLGDRPSSRRQRVSAHDPGQVLRDVAVMLADGGDCLSASATIHPLDRHGTRPQR